MDDVVEFEYEKDHCRIGSLENIEEDLAAAKADHCRIGSLEINCR